VKILPNAVAPGGSCPMSSQNIFPTPPGFDRGSSRWSHYTLGRLLSLDHEHSTAEAQAGRAVSCCAAGRPTRLCSQKGQPSIRSLAACFGIGV
jgi:hypothetical protein